MNVTYLICDNIFIQKKVLLNCLTSLLPNSTQELEISVFGDLRRFYETNRICTLSSVEMNGLETNHFLTGLAEIKPYFLPEVGQNVDQLFFTELTHNNFGAFDYKGYAISFDYKDEEISSKVFVNFIEFMDEILFIGVPITSAFYRDLFSQLKDYKFVCRTYYKDHGVNQAIDKELDIKGLAEFIRDVEFIQDEHVIEGLSQVVPDNIAYNIRKPESSPETERKSLIKDGNPPTINKNFADQQKHWLTIFQLAKRWKTKPKAIVELGANSDLEICFNWKVKTKDLGSDVEVVFFFEQNYQTNTPRVSKDIEFEDEITQYVSASKLKSHPLSCLCATSSIELTKLLTNHTTPLSSEYGELGLGWLELRKVGCNVVLYLDIDDLVVTRNEVERYERFNNIIVLKSVQNDSEQQLENEVNKSKIINEGTTTISNTDLLDKPAINHPKHLKLTMSFYEDVWLDQPSDMKNPSKAQLEHYLEVKLKALGLSHSTKLSDAIISLSKPDNFNFGGKQSAELRDWVPKNER
jgi:hypothetical protein